VTPRARRAIAALVAMGLAACLSCGKKGLPRAPQWVRPKPVEGLKAGQRGGSVVLALTPPRARTDGSPFEGDVLIRLTLLPESFAPPSKQAGRKSRAASTQRPGAVSWVIPKADWPAYGAGGRLEIPIPISSLELAARPNAPKLAGRQISFVAEVQEGKRWRSVVAGPVSLNLCDPPAAPTAIEARSAPTGILVWWRSSSVPAPPVQIYRAAKDAEVGEHPWKTLAAGTTSFLDDAAPAGEEYRYEVRLGRAEDPNRCESEAAGQASAARVDLFPPARPMGLAAAAEESLIRLFWSPGPETDITGYLVYRSDGPEEPYHLLTPVPITSTTFADSDLIRRKRYTYVVSAVDGAQPPNESGWSEPAEETLP
jgi:hypothetical protein